MAGVRLMKRSPLKRTDSLTRTAGLSRRAPSKRRGFTAASTAQRERVQDRRCVVCGTSEIEPAHLAARAQGGCDDPLCVIALCRWDHRLFDDNAIELLPRLEAAGLREEIAHAVVHLGLIGALHRLTLERGGV